MQSFAVWHPRAAAAVVDACAAELPVWTRVRVRTRCPPCCCSHRRFQVRVAPARALAPAPAQASMLKQEQELSPHWIVLRALWPCPCPCPCPSLPACRHPVRSPQCPCLPCRRRHRRRQQRPPHRVVDVRAWRGGRSCSCLPLRFGAVHGYCGSLARGKRRACHLPVSNLRGTALAWYLSVTRRRIKVSMLCTGISSPHW